MFGMPQRKAVVLLVLPAVLAFGIQSALEVFHPIEEGPNFTSHDHVLVGDGASVNDSSHADLRAHEHHGCAHSSALAYFGRLGGAFQRVPTSAHSVFDTEAAAVRSLLSVLDRGPPLL